MKQINKELFRIWRDTESESLVSQILYSSPFGFSELHLHCMLKTYEKYGLSTSAEPVLDALWKISYPILPLIYPSSYAKKFENGALKDWRNVLEEQGANSQYKPKIESLSIFDG